jgi:hypothetical protein
VRFRCAASFTRTNRRTTAFNGYGEQKIHRSAKLVDGVRRLSNYRGVRGGASDNIGPLSSTGAASLEPTPYETHVPPTPLQRLRRRLEQILCFAPSTTALYDLNMFRPWQTCTSAQVAARKNTPPHRYEHSVNSGGYETTSGAAAVSSAHNYVMIGLCRLGQPASHVQTQLTGNGASSCCVRLLAPGHATSR